MSLSSDFLHRINDLYQSFIKYDATQCDRINRYRNIEPESAYYLAMLIRVQRSSRILEIGTSTGHATLWLADAAQETGGHITTLEINPKRTEQAKRFARELNVDHVIDFWVGDAVDFLSSANQQYDLILLDAERSAYLKYWESLQHLINPCGGVLIVDNAISHSAEVQCLIQQIKKDIRFMTTTLALGSGLFMVTFKDQHP
ncbi:O-methyltransferase [Acinetobacter sp. WZC-1]|uniref:O-methyltransferase n=1 Tax=Acinetobacter sp. WZC-1 TaxID=3459034 RepID=UPI00403E3100